MHVHFHLIPKTKNEGLGIGWKPIKIKKDELKALGENIRKNLP